MSSAAHVPGAASADDINDWLKRIEEVSSVINYHLQSPQDGATADGEGRINSYEEEKKARKERARRRLEEARERHRTKIQNRYNPASYKRFEDDALIDKLLAEVDRPSPSKPKPGTQTTRTADLTEVERITLREAEIAKKAGNEAMQKGLFAEAFRHYSIGIGLQPPAVPDARAELSGKPFNELLVILYNNRSQASLSLGRPLQAAHDASYVLRHCGILSRYSRGEARQADTNRNNTNYYHFAKALLRRAKALHRLNKPHAAEYDLKYLLKKEGNDNPEAKALLAAVTAQAEEVDDCIAFLEERTRAGGSKSGPIIAEVRELCQSLIHDVALLTNVLLEKASGGEKGAANVKYVMATDDEFDNVLKTISLDLIKAITFLKPYHGNGSDGSAMIYLFKLFGGINATFDLLFYLLVPASDRHRYSLFQAGVNGDAGSIPINLDFSKSGGGAGLIPPAVLACTQCLLNLIIIIIMNSGPSVRHFLTERLLSRQCSDEGDHLWLMRGDWKRYLDLDLTDCAADLISFFSHSYYHKDLDYGDDNEEDAVIFGYDSDSDDDAAESAPATKQLSTWNNRIEKPRSVVGLKRLVIQEMDEEDRRSNEVELRLIDLRRKEKKLVDTQNQLNKQVSDTSGVNTDVKSSLWAAAREARVLPLLYHGAQQDSSGKGILFTLLALTLNNAVSAHAAGPAVMDTSLVAVSTSAMRVLSLLCGLDPVASGATNELSGTGPINALLFDGFEPQQTRNTCNRPLLSITTFLHHFSLITSRVRQVHEDYTKAKSSASGYPVSPYHALLHSYLTFLFVLHQRWIAFGGPEGVKAGPRGSLRLRDYLRENDGYRTHVVPACLAGLAALPRVASGALAAAPIPQALLPLQESSMELLRMVPMQSFAPSQTGEKGSDSSNSLSDIISALLGTTLGHFCDECQRLETAVGSSIEPSSGSHDADKTLLSADQLEAQVHGSLRLLDTLSYRTEAVLAIAYNALVQASNAEAGSKPSDREALANNLFENTSLMHSCVRFLHTVAMILGKHASANKESYTSHASTSSSSPSQARASAVLRAIRLIERSLFHVHINVTTRAVGVLEKALACSPRVLLLLLDPAAIVAPGSDKTAEDGDSPTESPALFSLWLLLSRLAHGEFGDPREKAGFASFTRYRAECIEHITVILCHMYWRYKPQANCDDSANSTVDKAISCRLLPFERVLLQPGLSLPFAVSTAMPSCDPAGADSCSVDDPPHLQEEALVLCTSSTGEGRLLLLMSLLRFSGYFRMPDHDRSACDNSRAHSDTSGGAMLYEHNAITVGNIALLLSLLSAGSGPATGIEGGQLRLSTSDTPTDVRQDVTRPFRLSWAKHRSNADVRSQAATLLCFGSIANTFGFINLALQTILALRQGSAELERKPAKVEAATDVNRTALAHLRSAQKNLATMISRWIMITTAAPAARGSATLIKNTNDPQSAKSPALPQASLAAIQEAATAMRNTLRAERGFEILAETLKQLQGT